MYLCTFDWIWADPTTPEAEMIGSDHTLFLILGGCLDTITPDVVQLVLPGPLLSPVPKGAKMPGFKRKRRWGNGSVSKRRRVAFRAFRRRRRFSRTRLKMRIPKRRFKALTPLSELRVHKWHFANTLTPTSTVQYYTFNVNDTYDPYAGTGGSQPYGRDQMVLRYKKYEVLQTIATVRVYPASGMPGPLYCGVLVQDDTDAVPTVGDQASWIENPHARYKIMANIGDVKPVFHRLKINNRKGLNDPWNNQAAYNNDPTARKQMVVWLTHAAGAAGVAHNIAVQLTMYTRWFDPIYTVASS